jgi:hypothetical protein
VVTCSKELRFNTPDADAATIVGIEYQEHQVLVAQRKEVINSLPDGNNEANIANIDREFAEKQQSMATVLLNKIVLLRDAVRVMGVHFHGTIRVYSVEISEGSGSTLVILNGIPLDHEHRPLREDLVDFAVTKETYVLYTQQK